MSPSALWRKLAFFVRRDRRMSDLADEMRLHQELRARQLIDDGVSPLEAAARVRRQFGNSAALAERSGDEWGLRWLQALRQDARFAARSFRRTPWATAAIVLSLALVIGANTAIFGLLHALLFRELPLPGAGQLVSLEPVVRGGQALITYEDYVDFRGAPGVPAIGAFRFEPAIVSVGDRRWNAWIDVVSGGFFDLLGAAPMLGRTISVGDEVARAPVAVISEEIWTRDYGADSAAIGKSISVGGPDDQMPLTIIGVMPRRYTGIHFARPAFAVAVPATISPAGRAAESATLDLIGRRLEGVSVERLTAALDAAFLGCCVDRVGMSSGRGGLASTVRYAQVADPPTAASRVPAGAADGRARVIVTDAARGLTWNADYREQYGRILVVLMAGVLTLALIGCANVGTLLLARAAAREREFAVRMSLGASRMQLGRQLLTESLELALAGGALGLLLAWAGTPVLLRLLPSASARLGVAAEWELSPAIFAFTLAIVAGSTLLFGIWPMRRATRVDIVTPLTGADRVMSGSRVRVSDRVLVVAQVALALVLVFTATLFAATLRNLTDQTGGFRTTRVIVARLSSDDARTEPGALGSTYERVLDEVRRIPGVIDAAAALSVPVINEAIAVASLRIPGYDGVIGGDRSVRFNPVSAGFFQASGVGLVRGREFSSDDRAESELVAIVSETFARRYFAGRDPIGASLVRPSRITGGERHFRIVGIARDARYDELRDPASEVWHIPLSQAFALRLGSTRNLMLAVRTSGDPRSVATQLRERISAAEPQARIAKLATVQQLLNDIAARERLAAVLATIFGIAALVLAAVGLYGLLSYHTSRRTHEIGVRMALGALPGDALRLVLRQTVALVGVGILVGLPLAFLAGLVIRSQLFGVAAGDPAVMIGSALVLVVVGLAASALPGRRAARVDPVLALRVE